MSVLGIELRPTFVAAALREAEHRPRLLDDGQRMLIPLDSYGVQWGSQSAAQPHSPWSVSEPAKSVGNFPTHLYDRVTRFLGGEPPAHSLRVVLATSALGLGQQFQAADHRFVVQDVISPPAAVVAAWLARHQQADSALQRVGAITIGDLSAEAAVFEVQTGPRSRILAHLATPDCPGTGVGIWTGRIIQEVRAHVTECADDATLVELWQAALEFGDLLQRSPPQAEMVWNGPLQAQMLSPWVLSRDLFGTWAEVAVLTQWLQSSVRRLLCHEKVDAILLSGVGASWPFDMSAFADLPTPIRTTDASTEIAQGATYWPRLQVASLAGERTRPSLPPPPQPLPGQDQSHEEHASPGIRDAEFDRLISEHLKDSPDTYE